MTSASVMSNGKEIVVKPEITSNRDDDRLSCLPDEVLVSILSLLNAMEVVQTCVLSKRWRNLWTFVPCLDFNDEKGTWWNRKGRDLKRFQNFVSSFLRLRDNTASLHTFKLCHRMPPYSVTWILHALKCNPKNLEITLSRENYFYATDRLFTCESLENLSLSLDFGKKIELTVPDNVFLPKLRKVNFILVKMKGDSMEKFLSGCPALESVKLECCILNMNYISFQSVKQLDIQYCDFCSDLDSPICSIFAPRLEYLEFMRPSFGAVKFKDMSKVKKAKINDSSSNLYINKCEYLSSFLGAEDLEIDISSYIKETLRGELRNCPIFHNLKNLTLGDSCFHCAFDVLASFLKHCPNLEHLTLSHEDCGCQDINLEGTERFSCDQLRSINVVCTGNDSDVDRLIQLLVHSTSELDQVQILLRRA